MGPNETPAFDASAFLGRTASRPTANLPPHRRAAPAPLPPTPATSFRVLRRTNAHTVAMLSDPAEALAAAVEPATSGAAAAAVFEPVLPDSTALLGMGSVVVLSIVAGLVWANAVVPVSRTKLAMSKSRGEVKEYLDGLREGADSTPASATDIEGESAASNDVVGGEKEDKIKVVKPDVGDGRDFERWLFSDWLNSGANSKAGRQKQPALPVLKKAKWNSGDNPVLVASALIGLCVVVAAVTERVGTLAGST